MMKNLLSNKLFLKLIGFVGGSVLAITFVLISPNDVSASHIVPAPPNCDNTAKWGINTGNPNHAGGLVVRTQLSDGTPVGGISWTLSTITGGFSIVHLNSAYNDDGWTNSITFTTATGPNNGGELDGAVWCNHYNQVRGSYLGYSVLGVGSELNYGNHFLISCKKYTSQCDDCLDPNITESYKITNVSTPSGKNSGYWTGSHPGWDTGFGVSNGYTLWITLTWIDTPPPILNAPPNPTSLSVTGLPSCSDTIYSVRTEFYVSQATSAEYQLFENGSLVQQTFSWTNLNPNFTYLLSVDWPNLRHGLIYTWQVRAGNSVGWSSWVWGPTWNVPSCPKPPKPADLKVEVEFVSGLTWDPAAGNFKYVFYPEETVYMDVRVENLGSDPVGEFWTKIYATTLNTACGNNTQQTQFRVSSLGGYSLAQQTVSFTVPSTPGDYTAWAFTDAVCQVSESNESNNTTSIQYSVSTTAKPDLVVEFMGLHDGLNHKTIFSPGETVYATVRINNVGGADSEPNPRTDVFREKLDGCNNTTYSQRLGTPFGITLFANGNTPVSLTFTFTAPLAGGNYTAYAFVDSFTTKAGPPPYCENDEINESNNVGSVEYNVVSPCPTFTLSAPSGSISTTTPYFSWSTSSGGGFQFQVQLSKISTFSSYWFSPLLPTSSTFLSWPADWQTSGSPGPPPNSGLEENVDYYWRVLVTNLASCVSAGVNFKYVGPAWMMTKGGDMVIKGNISLVPPPGILTTAEYAAIAQGDISQNDNSPFEANKISSRSWKLKNYSNLKTPPRSSYSYFWSLLSGEISPIGGTIGDGVIPTTGGVYQYPGGEFTLNPASTLNLTGPVVIFIGVPGDGQTGTLKITSDVKLSSTSKGIIFIVEGQVIVSYLTQEIHGIFISDGQFNSKLSQGAGSDNQLKVKGSVIAHGGFALPRDRGSLNLSDLETSAAEFFEFQPRYLVEFREIIGAPLYSWTEVSP